MSAAQTGFDPPSPDGSDRVIALLAAIDAKGDTIRPPRCVGYANGCHCPACKLREDRSSNGMRRLRAA